MVLPWIDLSMEAGRDWVSNVNHYII